jgi:hypothetical protein
MIIMPYGWPPAHRCSSQARLTSGTSQGRGGKNAAAVLIARDDPPAPTR